MSTNFTQNLTFKPQPEKILEEFNFDGGYITDTHETKLKNNQTPNVENVLYNNTGSIKTRNGYLRYNGNPVGVTADQSNTGGSAGHHSMTSVSDYVAQTFIPSGTIFTVQVDLYLGMETAGEEQYVRVELWATDGTEPTILITNGEGQIKLISGVAETAYNFYFRLPVSLSAATTYAIVVRPVAMSSSQSVSQVNVYYRNSSYADGQDYTSTDAGTNWTAGGNDLRFAVYSGGNAGCTGLIRYYSDTGIQQFFSKFGTTLYRGNDVTGALTAITPGSGVSLTAGNFIDWTIVNNTLLVVDHSNKIFKYRGSTNANYSTGTILVTNASTAVVGSGTTWATTTNVEVGEYIKLPDSKWYKIISIADNTHLTVEQSYQGSTVSGQTYTISPWGEVQGKLNSSVLPSGLVRPTPQFIENHINRIWTLDGNALRFSVLDTSVTEEHFNDWDTANNAGEIIIPAGKGDSGTGLYSLGNSLYIFQRKAIWRLYGNSPANFELRNVTNEIGMIDKRTLVEWNDVLIFLSDKGVYSFDGSNLKNMTDKIINNFIDTWSNKTSPVATLWNNRYILAYTPTGQSYNTEAIFMDLTTQIWGKVTGVYVSAWSSWTGGTDTGQIYFGSSNQGSLYQWDVGGHDDGYEIYTLYDTPSFSFGQGINDKAIKKFYLQQIAVGDWDMTVTQLSNINETEIAGEAITLSVGAAVLWDVAQWDVDSWPSEGTLITTRVAEFQGLAKYFKFRLEQTGYNEGIEVLGILGTARLRRLS